MLLLITVLLLSPQSAPTQTVRGLVLERTTQAPLPGANVVVLGSNPLLGAVTDRDGRFELQRVPLGRHDIQVSFLGFETRRIDQVLVSAGKEVVLTIELSEAVLLGEGIEVTPETPRGHALNALALTSARTFSVEETRRYAGGLDDPARMASAFAGITTSVGVQENAIVVRGNAPKGVLWQLEGVEIPNPNHFAGLSVAGGGGLTLFSSQLLADSDFMTGAFPAEYGNALAGVFDMTFRTGHPERREHAIQAGVLGIEFASEGPFVTGRPATYLFNYRYSTIGLLLPILPTEDVAAYQDLSFKVSLPSRGLGRLDFWGIGGLDAQRAQANRDSSDWEFETWDRLASDLHLATGAAGVSHRILTGSKAYLHTTLAATLGNTILDQDRLGDDLQLREHLAMRSTDARFILSSYLNRKINAGHTHRVGVSAQRLIYDQTVRTEGRTVIEGQGHAHLLEGYSQSMLSFGRIGLTPGVRVSHFSLTGETLLEPRFGVRLGVGARRSVSLGYGLHSRIEELRLYFVRTPNGVRTNSDLGRARAHHLVLGYETAIGEGAHMRVEAYMQRLFRVPVIADSSFSMLNFEQDLTFESELVNKGTGRNQGIELTLERYLRDGYYHLLTGSIFRSTYQGGDRIWRPTRFDRGYSITALAGKEFTVGGDDLMGLNLRLSAAGGKRRSPVDVARSIASEAVIYDESRAFEERLDGQFVLDATVTWRRNHERISEVWALQVKNVLGAKDQTADYSYASNRVVEVREGFPLPILSWKMEF